jgi:hypothetical protein
MPDFIEISGDIERLVELVDAFSAATARADRARLLSQMREQLEKLRVADEEAQAALRESCETGSERAGRNIESERAALALRQNENAVVKKLLPRILSLQRYLTGTPLDDEPEAHQLLEKAVNIAAGYVAGYQDLRDQLLSMDAEERASSPEVLRVRLVSGEIDYADRTREIIARYPKILAALAK